MVESGPVAVESVGTAAGSTTLVVAVLGTPGDHDFVLRDAVGQEKWRVVGSLTPGRRPHSRAQHSVARRGWCQCR